MVRRARLAVFFACLLLWSPALAGDADSELKAWMARQADVRIIEGRFLQHRKTPLLAEPLVSAGTFRLERPDRMRWVVENPETLVLEMDGDQVRGGRPGRLRVLPEIEGMAGFREMTGLFFGGSDRAIDRFKVASGSEPNSFILVPRESGEHDELVRMTMVIAGPEGGLSEVYLESRTGDASKIRFLDVQLTRTGRESAR